VRASPSRRSRMCRSDSRDRPLLDGKCAYRPSSVDVAVKSLEWSHSWFCTGLETRRIAHFATDEMEPQTSANIKQQTPERKSSELPLPRERISPLAASARIYTACRYRAPAAIGRLGRIAGIRTGVNTMRIRRSRDRGEANRLVYL
jgi:hypothetical protein